MSAPARRAGVAIAAAGVLLGTAVAVVAFAPATWIAGAVASATGDRLQLADARGSVWSGSAVAVLTGGAGSRDASELPGRLSWTVGLDGLAIGVRARQPCCLTGELRARVEPGIGRWRITLPASAGPLGRWPAAWLGGLGTPFNTLKLGGSIAVATTGLVAESVAGRWRLAGDAVLTLEGLASQLSTLETLGSYRVAVSGGEPTRLVLSTLDGPLQLAGSGQWTATGLRFRGEAHAAPGFESALDNLLNLLGRRQGALAVISIG